MARTKRIIRVRREGEIISESTRPQQSKRTKRALPKVQAKGSVTKGINKSRPKRKHLTACQWQEWGDNLRVLNRYDYQNARTLSLVDSRDAIRSVQRCSGLRFMAQ